MISPDKPASMDLIRSIIQNSVRDPTTIIYSKGNCVAKSAKIPYIRSGEAKGYFEEGIKI